MQDRSKIMLQFITRQKSSEDIQCSPGSATRRNANSKKNPTLSYNMREKDRDEIIDPPTPAPRTIQKIFERQGLNNLPVAFSSIPRGPSPETGQTRKRRSGKELQNDKALKNVLGMIESTENINFADRIKTAEDLSTIINALQNHFIFFFSNRQNCKT